LHQNSNFFAEKCHLDYHKVIIPHGLAMRMPRVRLVVSFFEAQ